MITVGTVVTHAGFYNHFDAAHHTLRVHTAPPVRVVCGLGRLLTRSRGQFDLLPAGQRERWRDLDPGEAVEVRIARDELSATPRFHVADPLVEQVVCNLEYERRAGSPHGPMFREGLTLALVALLQGVRATAGGLTRKQERIVAELVADDLASDLTIARLASAAGVSASQLKTRFKRSFGVTPHAYVIGERVRRARQLLEHTDRSLAEIAYDVGFAHPSHLARWMRRIAGVSPRVLRHK